MSEPFGLEALFANPVWHALQGPTTLSPNAAPRHAAIPIAALFEEAARFSCKSALATRDSRAMRFPRLRRRQRHPILLGAALLIILGALLCSRAAPAAEYFYMDRDTFSDRYTGPVGPLVLSGEIVPGDYARFKAKIAEDPQRFLSQNELILASSDGNALEAMKIADLVKAMETEVTVGPLTGRCAGACFLIYAAAARRGTDGENLLGVSRPGLAASEWVPLPTAQAALLEDAMQAPVRAFLAENEVPASLVEETFKRPATDIYWLSEQDERALGAKSAAFRKLLAENCGWSEEVERAAYTGDTEGLKKVTECRDRLTQAAARKAFEQASKEDQPHKDHPRKTKRGARGPADQSSTTRGK